MKRKPDQILDRKQLLEQDDNEVNEKNSCLESQTKNLGKIDTQEEIAKRKIIKIKGPKTDHVKEDIHKEVKFTLNQELSSSQNQQNTSGQFSFLNNNNKDQQKSDDKEDKSQEQKGQKKGLFANLFDVSSPGKNIFSTSKDQQGEKSDQQKSSLFSNLQNQQMPSLFSNLDNKQQQTSLFGNMDANQKTSLFSNNQTGLFSSLFNSNNQSSSIFDKKNSKSKESDDENDNEGDDQLQKSESPEVDPSKAKKNVEIDSDYEKIFFKDVYKIKINTSDSQDQGQISIEKQKQGEQIIFVLRSVAKRILYQGYLIKKLSESKILNERQDALSLISFSLKQQENEEKKEVALKDKFNRDIIKIMFSNKEDCLEFQSKFKELV